MSERCPTCGRGKPGLRRYWTDERIVAALQAWTVQYGQPPRDSDWRNSAPEHPSRRTVGRAFVSWNAALEAAGLPTRQPFASRPASRAASSEPGKAQVPLGRSQPGWQTGRHAA